MGHRDGHWMVHRDGHWMVGWGIGMVMDRGHGWYRDGMDGV